MNLLLLLSALLSALTGAVPGVRRADMPQAVAQQAVRTATVAIAARPVIRHPGAVTPTLIAVVYAAIRPAIRVIAAPIWMDRRRE